jgi:hypothetical protein
MLKKVDFAKRLKMKCRIAFSFQQKEYRWLESNQLVGFWEITAILDKINSICFISVNYFGVRPKKFQSLKLGVDVMITIFFDFRQFSAKIGVFLKNQCYDQNFT